MGRWWHGWSNKHAWEAKQRLESTNSVNATINVRATVQADGSLLVVAKRRDALAHVDHITVVNSTKQLRLVERDLLKQVCPWPTWNYDLLWEAGKPREQR